MRVATERCQRPGGWYQTGNILYRCGEVSKTDCKSVDDTSDCCPPGVCGATFYPCKCRDGDAGNVGDIFLSSPMFVSQLTQRAGEGLVC
jgi:hypothetical protein